MANEHPFQMLFETLGRLPIAHAESVNRQAYEILYDILSVPVEKAGRCVMLRAPRAGHGKTHLLARVQHHLGASHEFIPLHAAFGCQIDASTVIDDSLRRLLRPLPASGGLCVLDLVTRRLFSAALQPLVSSGEVPCQDREGALSALRTRPIETFDFHHPNAVTAHWARENFEVLGQRLSVELAQRCNLPAREVAFWVDALFRFAATPVENPVRLRVLADSVHAGDPVDAVLMERLEALLGMLTLLMRVVLVADDLEGFSTDETAALRLAAFLGELRQSVERLDVVLSLNQDIWESAFVPKLSGGLADRLSEVVVELNPLTEDEMVALLESRVPGLGARVLSKVDRHSAGSHARGLIRAAGIAWLRASAMDTQPSVAAVPAQEVPVSAPSVPEPPVIADVPAAVVQAPKEEAAVPAASPFGSVPTPDPDPAPVASEPVMVESPVVETPAPSPVATPAPVERTPDPTLAIGFLAASAKGSGSADSWSTIEHAREAAEAESTPPAGGSFVGPAGVLEESAFQAAASPAEALDSAENADPHPASGGSIFERGPGDLFQTPVEAPAFQAAPDPSLLPSFAPVSEAPQAFQPPVTPPSQPEPEPLPGAGFQPVEAAPAAAMFQPVKEEPPATPAFQPAPEPPLFQPAPEPVAAPAFQPVPEPPPAPAFQAAPEPPVFQPAIENPPLPAPDEAAVPVFHPVAEPAEEKAPDTDRVDELLRQFRERYGRGSM